MNFEHVNSTDDSRQLKFSTGKALCYLVLIKTDTADFYNKHFCRSCMTNKLRRPTYNKSIPKANIPGARWYMDNVLY